MGSTYGIWNNGTGSVNIIGGSVNKCIYNGSTGAVTVSGGTVVGDTCGIQNDGTGTVSVSGGSVSGETGIDNPNGGRVVVSTGSVSGEYTGIYNGNTGSTVTVSGGSVSGKECGIDNYNATATVSGGNVTGSSGYGIKNESNGTFKLSGVPTITGTTADIYLNNAIITIGDGGLTYTSDKAISVKMSTPGTFTSGWTEKMGENADYDSYFTSADSTYTVQPDGSGELKLAEPPAHSHDMSVECGGSGVTFEPWDGTTTFPGGNVYLTDDVTLNETLTISSGTVNLCLNGHNITKTELN